MSSSITINPPGAAAVQSYGPPKEGPRGFPITVPFSGTVTRATVDLSQFMQSGKISQILSMFVDNWANPAATVISIPGTNISIEAPANTQGWYRFPFAAPGGQIVFANTGAVAVNFQFTNYEVTPVVWSNSGSAAAPTVTANQGAAGGSPWPTTIYYNGSPLSGSNGLPISEAVLDASSSTATPTSGTGSATKMLLEGGLVYSAGTYAVGTQLPLLLTVNGRLVVSDPTITSIITTEGLSPTPAYAHIGGAAFATLPARVNGDGYGLALTLNGELSVDDANTAGVNTTIAPATAAPNAFQIAGVYDTAGITLTNGQSAALQLNANGKLVTADATLSSAATNIAPSASGTLAIPAAGVYNAAPTEWTNGQKGALGVDSFGSLMVDTETQTPTYAASFASNVPASVSVGFLFGYIQGSATKTIRVKRIGISMVSGTAASAGQVVFKRASGATAFAGGSPTTAVDAQYDINDPAATAVVVGLNAVTTSNPTLGATFRIAELPIVFGSSSNGYIELDFGNTAKSFVLRGVQDYLVVELSSAGPSSTFIANVYIEWTEV